MLTFVLKIVNLTTDAPCIERVVLDRATWIGDPAIAEGHHITSNGDVEGELMFDNDAQRSKSTLDVAYGPLRPGQGSRRVTIEFGAAMVKGVPELLCGVGPPMSCLAFDVYPVATAAVFTCFVIIRLRPAPGSVT